MNGLMRLFERRVRGIRLVELIGLILALIMVFWVGFAKVREGEAVTRLNALNRDIATQESEIKALKVKVANLEQPARLEALAKQYLGMGPVDPTREAKLDNLVEISQSLSRPDKGAAPNTTPAPATPPVAPVTTPVAEAAPVTDIVQ